MLEDAAGIRKVVLACGYVDLRKGIDGLSRIIGDKYHQNPFEKGTLFLFCGGVLTGLKGFYGWETGLCFSINVLKRGHYRGPGPQKKQLY